MGKSDLLAQLSALNELFSQLGKKDPELAEHGNRALQFYRHEQTDESAKVDLQAYVERLADLHLGEDWERELAVAHWHVPATELFGPLWIRQAIVAEMKKLAGRRAALLLVTGLREGICPEGRRWTQARENEFRRVMEWVDELACAWATRGSRLQVVVL